MPSRDPTKLKAGDLRLVIEERVDLDPADRELLADAMAAHTREIAKVATILDRADRQVTR